MWSIRRPTPEQVRTLLEQARALPCSYPQVGCSATSEVPPGYQLDHNRIVLGHGEAVFEEACAALRRWQHFPAPWTEIHPADTPLAVGNQVAILVRALGLWWLNAARIVCLVDERTPVRRFGFAYGTLPGHVEQGEEQFTIELHPDGTTWYDVWAVSRPRYWMTRLAYPLTRILQKRFARDSKAAMKRLVASRAGPASVGAP